MDIASVLALVAAKFPIAGLVFLVLGCLVVLGQVVVVATPSKSDDAAWDKLKALPVIGQILSALAAFAPIQKK